ncbi:co-chaperone DjlA [Ferrimonas lipolytica]|uniref:Co-chaperone protein DjlA n=1 Tax=Ferrimonas lipolytica TaxID=2724191 RepID=A0A6H1UGR2_9GAMM|nr:co-chaperone DjlA [Ferrimonas lipolytica]QIZ77819.1 co-chaperone DjlA [Ferrimonas lipolytica]
MRIWGKLIGAGIGFMMGKWFGALLGLYLGHRFIDARRQRRPNPFFHTTFAVMGHMAKSTGQVTQQDIALASALMDQLGLRGDARIIAQQAFSDGKSADYPLRQRLKQLGLALRFRRDLAQMFVEIQIQVALADGEVQAPEMRLLEIIAHELGFNQEQLAQMLARQKGGQHGQQTGMNMADACQILGVDEADDLRTIKRAYRKLMSQHHPDKLASQGLPPEMAQVAQEKSQQIQSAWEFVRANKGE